MKWAKGSEGTLQPDKLPITAALFSSSHVQQNQKMSDKPFSSLLPASKPHLHDAIIHDNSQADSGMFSSGSYLSMNGDVDKHGVLSRDQSSLDFYPLRAYIEGDSPKVSVESLWNMFKFLLWLLLSGEPVYCFTLRFLSLKL